MFRLNFTRLSPTVRQLPRSFALYSIGIEDDDHSGNVPLDGYP
jgi:hypothetical protein